MNRKTVIAAVAATVALTAAAEAEAPRVKLQEMAGFGRGMRRAAE